jgi:hypothetical protein
MKKRLFLVVLVSLLLVIGLTLVSCAKADTPTDVVKKLHKALAKGDIKAAGNYMTDEAAGIIAMFGEKATQTIVEYGDIVDSKETINDDKAKVEVTYKNGDNEDWDLVKVDGKWKVTIDQSSK